MTGRILDLDGLLPNISLHSGKEGEGSTLASPRALLIMGSEGYIDKILRILRAVLVSGRFSPPHLTSEGLRVPTAPQKSPLGFKESRIEACSGGPKPLICSGKKKRWSERFAAQPAYEGWAQPSQPRHTPFIH